MAAFVSMLRMKKKVGLVILHFSTPSPHPRNPKYVKTDYAITTYKMVDELWLYTDNTSMLKRSMPK